MSVLGDTQNLTGRGPEKPVLVDPARWLPEVPSNHNCETEYFKPASAESWAACLNLTIIRLCSSSLTSCSQPFPQWSGRVTWGKAAGRPGKALCPCGELAWGCQLWGDQSRCQEAFARAWEKEMGGRWGDTVGVLWLQSWFCALHSGSANCIWAPFWLATWKLSVSLRLPEIFLLPACVALSFPLSASGYHLSQVVGFWHFLAL